MSRYALVTGASAGIGRATAVALLKDGFAVALIGRRKEALEETAAMVPGATSLVIPADVGDAASVAAAFATLKQSWSRLDLVFNNAGGNVPATNFGDMTDEQWDGVVAVNLSGAFRIARNAFQMMREQTPQGGRIINNGSVSAHTPRPGSVAYTATKHGITGLTKSISLDGRKYGIACGQIDVGNAATPMTRRMSAGVPQANGTMAPEATMDVENVARSVLLMANMPPDANVFSLMVTATEMPFVGRG